MSSNKPKSKQSANQKPFEKPSTKPAQTPSTPLLERIETWLAPRFRWLSLFFFLSFFAVRILLVNQVASSPLSSLYKYTESDNLFFHHWAGYLADGNWACDTVLHPHHWWHKNFSEYYLKQHPDKKAALEQAIQQSGDTLMKPEIALWNEWYGGKKYHQEPFYPYLLAIFKKITSDEVYAMTVAQALAGALAGLLLVLLTARYFGYLAALVSGVLYLFCGTLLAHDAILLRTTFSSFFIVLLIWQFQRSMDKPSLANWVLTGLTLGFAYTLQSWFIAMGFVFAAIHIFKNRQQWSTAGISMSLMFGAAVLVFSPVIFRNLKVGAPIFSENSTGTVTWVVPNASAKSTIAWIPEADPCAEIMGKSGGKFLPAVIETYKTYDGIHNFFEIHAEKLKGTFAGIEVTGNENYYFYRENISILQWMNVDFFIIGPLGIAGFLFAFFYRRQPPLLLASFLIQFAILMVFYSNSRLRSPMVMLFVPYAGFAVSALLDFSEKRLWLKILKPALVAGLLIFYQTYYDINLSNLIRGSEYTTVYDNYFLSRLQERVDAKQWLEAIKIQDEFLKLEPDVIRDLKDDKYVRQGGLYDATKFFARMYEIRKNLYYAAGDSTNGRTAETRMNLYKKVVANTEKYNK